MSTFTAYLDDQDLIRIQKGEEHILPFSLSKRQVQRLTQETIS